MSGLAIKPPTGTGWDLIALGEVMLRLDPGDLRIATARGFRVWEGGGEYNVARGLSQCFGLRTAIVTALADNPVGRLVEGLIRQGGVDQSQIRWVPYDGVGRAVRNGLNFVERGFGVRGALGCSDRGNTAISQLRPDDVDWQAVFGARGARWFHCGGVFAGLSESSADVALAAMRAARRHGTVVSYDVNYRPSLWSDHGGSQRAAAVNGRLIEQADVLFGADRAAVGLTDRGSDADLGDPLFHREAFAELLDAFPNLSLVAGTVRTTHSANVNDWGAVCHSRDGFHVGPRMPGLEILDRIGGGDSFASGFVYGLMSGEGIDAALAYGVAHGALAMTTPGDASMATLADVRRLVDGGRPGVQR